MSMRALITMMAAIPAYSLPPSVDALPHPLPERLQTQTRRNEDREEKMAKAAAKRLRRQAKRLAEGRHL